MWGDSLWPSDFTGYLNDRGNVGIGDTFVIRIDSDFSLAYRSTSVDSKNLTLEFSGGEYGDLFSFVPRARTAGHQDVRGASEHAMTSLLAAKVVNLDPDGGLLIQGSRTLEIDGREESLSVSGRIDPRDGGANREVPISRITDLRVVYRSMLQPSDDVLTAEDVEFVLQGISEEISEGESAGLPSGGTESGTESGGASTTRLTEEKKRELFLRYVNNLMDLIWQ